MGLYDRCYLQDIQYAVHCTCCKNNRIQPALSMVRRLFCVTLAFCVSSCIAVGDAVMEDELIAEIETDKVYIDAVEAHT